MSVSRLAAASMEGGTHAHNRPLLADQLEGPGYNRGDVVIAPLFLSPGRHAGVQGDLAQIGRVAEDRSAAALRCHFTGLVGTHPLAVEALARTLGEAPIMKKGGWAAYP
jgi:sirohydrochlorin ferrochelatase